MTRYIEPNPSLLPPCAATTSWELFEDIIQIMEAQPARVTMSCFTGGVYDREDGSAYPECGMMGCIGGWICMRRGQFGFDVISSFAYDQLPESVHGDAYRLFFEDEDDQYPWPKEHPGTREYVDVVVGNIRKFMAKNEEALKAFKLPELVKP